MTHTITEIKTLDDKYLVIKREDLEEFFSYYRGNNIFVTDEQQAFIDAIPFKIVIEQIQITREVNGKSENHYVVLNMNDEIDLTKLIDYLKLKQMRVDEAVYSGGLQIIKVKDIAINLVNAILSAKDKSP